MVTLREVKSSLTSRESIVILTHVELRPLSFSEAFDCNFINKKLK